MKVTLSSLSKTIFDALSHAMRYPLTSSIAVMLFYRTTSQIYASLLGLEKASDQEDVAQDLTSVPRASSIAQKSAQPLKSILKKPLSLQLPQETQSAVWTARLDLNIQERFLPLKALYECAAFLAREKNNLSTKNQQDLMRTLHNSFVIAVNNAAHLYNSTSSELQDSVLQNYFSQLKILEKVLPALWYLNQSAMNKERLQRIIAKVIEALIAITPCAPDSPEHNNSFNVVTELMQAFEKFQTMSRPTIYYSAADIENSQSSAEQTESVRLLQLLTLNIQRFRNEAVSFEGLFSKASFIEGLRMYHNASNSSEFYVCNIKAVFRSLALIQTALNEEYTTGQASLKKLLEGIDSANRAVIFLHSIAWHGHGTICKEIRLAALCLYQNWRTLQNELSIFTKLERPSKDFGVVAYDQPARSIPLKLTCQKTASAVGNIRLCRKPQIVVALDYPKHELSGYIDKISLFKVTTMKSTPILANHFGNLACSTRPRLSMESTMTFETWQRLGCSAFQCQVVIRYAYDNAYELYMKIQKTDKDNTKITTIQHTILSIEEMQALLQHPSVLHLSVFVSDPKCLSNSSAQQSLSRRRPQSNAY